MATVWTNTDKVSLENGVKIMTYGEAGTGKTSAIATLPTPVIVSAENGLLPLRKLSIPAIIVQNYNDVVEVYNWLATSPEARQFQSVALDSISELGEVVLKDFKSRTKDARMAYGQANEAMLELIKLFRDLPRFNVYMTSKLEYLKDESGYTRSVPMFPGKQLAPNTPYLFDFLFRSFVQVDDKTKQRKFLLQTGNDQNAMGKDRSGILNFMEEPNLGSIIARTFAS